MIDSITVQGSHTNEPADYADVNENVAVTAVVHDAETAADQLQYQWTASEGTIAGTGASATWTAPASIPSPQTVTITLTVVENYGSGGTAGQNKTVGTATVSLHDMVTEVGTMSRQFLIDFSNTSLTDADYVLRNFSKARCPTPSEVDSERADVIKNYTNFIMQSFTIGAATVTVNFGGSCPTNHGPKKGDACALVPSYWDSIDRADNQRRAVDGNDLLSAAYSAADNRWWLCSSDYDGHQVSGPPFPSGIPWFGR